MMSEQRSASGFPPMRSRRAFAMAMAGVAMLAVASAQASKEKEKDHPAGQRSLFDGKTLDGWKKTDFAHPGVIKVEDGQIVMATGSPMTGITTTRKDLPKVDYELTFEAMRTTGEDFFAASTFPVGKSYITLINGGWGGFVTGLSSLDGMDASENETTRSFRYDNKKWYRFRVRVTASVIRCWVNDEEIVAVEHREMHVGTRVETHANEPLGFASWKSGGALRNITIRPLTRDEIAATDKIDSE